MKNLITLLLLAALFSCEKDNPTYTKNWFPYKIDKIYYHSDTTDSKIVFKGLSVFPTDFDGLEITISMSPTARTATNLGNKPIEGFELLPSDFSPAIPSFDEGTFDGIRVENDRDSIKVLYP